MGVDFYEENRGGSPVQKIESYTAQGGALTRAIISAGLARTARGAQPILIVLAILALGLAVYVWLSWVADTAVPLSQEDIRAVTTDLER